MPTGVIQRLTNQSTLFGLQPLPPWQEIMEQAAKKLPKTLGKAAEKA